MSAMEATPPGGFTWGPIREGTAVAEVVSIPVSHEDIATVTPLWSDDEGVVFDIDLPEAPLSVNGIAKMLDTLSRISMMSPFY
ncbi:hypothetical protein NYO98_10585 [Nocardioides sp. STR2]|uniref:Uncharacterized protein n=1 Tax=Nocardioides pini TaxID=2975053 RepID=A0ABT4CCM6_9ACTN|nr:hypothetical protein [Nocardioides pini]MCY4726725.1 hypothetical protein [Nocardioides pini]